MGVDAQLGIAEEVTFGTYVAPSDYYEFLSESVKLNIGKIESAGWQKGVHVVKSTRRKPGAKTVEGDIQLEVPNKGFGFILKHAFGAIASAQPDVANSPTVWDHTATLGDIDGKSLSIQVGRDDRAGTVHPFSYTGCKIASLKLEASLDDYLKATLGIIGRDESTAQSLGAATYPAGLHGFTFVEGSLTVEAASVPVKSFSLDVNNGLSADHAFGSALSREQRQPARRELTGTFDADFDGLTEYNLFTAGTLSTLVLLFESDTISDNEKFGIQITAEVQFDGETPGVGGPEEVRLTMPYKVVAPDSGEPISVRYRTTDTTP